VIGTRAGTGKGLLIDVMVIPGTGRPAPTSNYPDDAAEATKVKTAIALGGDPVVHFDNLAEGSTYGNSALDGALTARSTNDRLLGSNSRPILPLRTSWFLSGNNLAPASDAYRRWLVCNLVTPLEHPEDRTDLARRDLRRDVSRDRGEVVRDALTILRAHSLAGRPGGGGRMGSYEDWDEVVRGAAWFATGSDPLATQRRAAESSPSRMREIALLEGWRRLPGGGEGGAGVLATDAIALANERTKGQPDESALRNKTLHHALQEYGVFANKNPARSLGNFLRALDRKALKEMKFEKASEGRDGVRWRVTRAPDIAKGEANPAASTDAGDA
jgi:hypothetical protein